MAAVLAAMVAFDTGLSAGVGGPRPVHLADGSWAPVDTSLRELPDGTVTPVAFSGGGAGRRPTLSVIWHS